MIQSARVSLAARLLKRLNLRFPTLALILGLLTLFDFLLPDFIPFIDEIGLALLTILFGLWEKRKTVDNQDGER
jgi:hypothetical protein